MFLREDPECFEVKDHWKRKGSRRFTVLQKRGFSFFLPWEPLTEEEYYTMLSGDNPHYLFAVPGARIFLDGKD